LRVQRDGRQVTVTVSADGDEQTVTHVGAALLGQCAQRTGLEGALSAALAPLRARRGRHDPGRTLLDLAVVIADGGRSLADLRTIREQGVLFGAVASDATAWRTVTGAAQRGLLDRVRAARAAARARAWQAGMAPAGPLIIDIDASLISTHTEKDGTAGTCAGGWGFHPLLAFLDSTREPLAALLRPGNAPAHTAADHIAVLELALAQIPPAARAGQPLMVRCDSAGATHAFTDACAEAGIAFSVTINHTPALVRAIAAVADDAWQPAVDDDGQPRDNGEVVELTDHLDLSRWPRGSRVIVRRERPHPGAQLRLADVDGFRYQATLTSQAGADLATIERTHRQRGRCEQRVCALKDTGARNLPFGDQHANAIWLELCLTAGDLICWTQHLALDGDLSVCEPRTLRYRLLHAAGRLAFHARQARLRIPRSWPWAGQLAAAFARLAALPTPA
jgi:Transposase DDE domain group 1